MLLAALTLGGCGGLPSRDTLVGWVTPYRIDIVQGNVVTKEQAALVRPGMNRTQVRDILGSPMLTDIFHADRWDYVFTINRPGTQPQHRHVIARFKGDALESLEAPALPTELEFVASIDRFKPGRVMPQLALTDAQKQALPKPPKTEEPPPAPVGALRSYPPLEPS
jgi:outer membrane protein assembly factor BamE